jgi:two-component system nitrogen regulation sensor histidine kinase NtrY
MAGDAYAGARSAAAAAHAEAQAAIDRFRARRARSRLKDRPFGRGRGPAYYIGLSVIGGALISGVLTYAILTGLTPIEPTHDVVVSMLLINVLLVLAMLVVVARQVWQLIKARRNKVAGARLHVSIVTLFSVIAVVPAIVIALFATSSLNRALDHLFSQGTQRIVASARDVARAYLQEHGQVIRSDIVAMANDVEGLASNIATRPREFEASLFGQASLRNLSMARIIDGKGNTLAVAPLPNAPAPNPSVGKLLLSAASGDVVIVPPGKTNEVGALKRLSALGDGYLYVARSVNGKVLDQLRETDRTVAMFRQLEERRVGAQLAIGLMYVELTVMLLLAAVWLGMRLANGLVAPIRRMISAAQEVARGNLDASLPIKMREGDLAHLSSNFNLMTQELAKQRGALVSANEQLSSRRRFIEAVLSGVSAGVIGVDAAGRITLVNPSARMLLGKREEELVGTSFAEAVPAFASLLETAKAEKRKDRLSGQADLQIDGSDRHFAIQVTREQSAGDNGFVVTFDDITGLVSAQRTSAWADVARRIAHEIKNPLTPIQLSAERLKRKYGKVITEDREVFDRCTDTIIRQVGDLGRMVDEFSSFARMPKAIMEPYDVNEIAREVIFLFQSSNPAIEIRSRLPDAPLILECDRRLLTQALTNLVKNATEAIGALSERPDAPSGFSGEIEVVIADHGEKVEIAVIDNGIGLPKKDRSRLVEPYMTTRAKGTGIGLAVVHKVTEQHEGELRLEDAPLNGTRRSGAAIRLFLPRQRERPAARETGIRQAAAE